MYKDYKQLNLPEIDRNILEFWEREKIFEKSITQRPADKSFVFYEGPPSANGKPGIHHVMARTVKDVYCRFHSMKGKRVERKGGWDTHGLPIELNVEKELGITKEDIGTKISVDDYNKACREMVMRYKNMWDDLTRKMGYWVDLDNPYITFENNYIESVWWLLQQLYKKDLLYKGYTIQPYSPAAGTGLSSHELNMPGAYKNVKDTSIVAAFKVEYSEKSAFLFDDKAEDVRILAWTTTPWTLPSNTALTVGPKIKYVKIKTHNPYTNLLQSVVLAEDLVSKWFDTSGDANTKKPQILAQSASFLGSQLAGIRYEQLLVFGNPIEPVDGATDAFRVITDTFVTTSDGTGIVHTAPSFGADDRMAGKKNGIGALTLVDRAGKFLPTVGEFSNRYIKDYKNEPNYRSVDIDISIKLKQENKAFDVRKYEHNYPHCWRTDKPVLYYPLDSWFIKASKMKGRMVELNKTINWKPKSTGEGRFGTWLENLQDWNLSRSRYWGIPLPIWRTEDGKEEICIGSFAELEVEIEKANAALHLSQTLPKDMHRPYVDEIVLVSPSGQPMKRELDLIDVWFDSGSMPYAQWHYPFENKDVFEKNFPADFIAEGVDQTRGWFYTLHAIATMVFDSVAFKNVVSNGLVLDEKGEKMSKSKGNIVNPFDTLSLYGADATRWYMMGNSNHWDNLKFDLKGVEEVRNKFFGTLYNTYNFFALYANIDGFKYKEKDIPHENRPEIDRWIISKLYSLMQEVNEDYQQYESTQAVRKIQDFVLEQLSNWYVRLSRRRFWKGDYTIDKISAYQTLYKCMVGVAKMMAPVSPFFSDWLFQNLNEVSKKEKVSSVHLTNFPKPLRTSHIDKGLEERMEYAQKISSLVLSLRKKEKIRVRQPLQKIMLPILDPNFQSQVEGVKDLILSEVNVKEIEFLTDASGVIKKKIKPNFKTLGKRLGKHMKTASQIISDLQQSDIAQFEQSGKFVLSIEEERFELNLEDVEIVAEDIPGLLVANDGALTVALDVNITPILEAEGIAREIVNRIQNIRKEQNFEVTDRINVEIQTDDLIVPAVEQFGDYIKAEVLGNTISLVSIIENGVLVDLIGEKKLHLSVIKHH